VVIDSTSGTDRFSRTVYCTEHGSGRKSPADNAKSFRATCYQEFEQKSTGSSVTSFEWVIRLRTIGPGAINVVALRSAAFVTRKDTEMSIDHGTTTRNSATDDADELVEVWLDGGPLDLGRQRTVPRTGPGESVKIPYQGGYEHFAPTASRRAAGERDLPVFCWTQRTSIAE
jgi:uncharacterized protein DUF5988